MLEIEAILAVPKVHRNNRWKEEGKQKDEAKPKANQVNVAKLDDNESGDEYVLCITTTEKQKNSVKRNNFKFVYQGKEVHSNFKNAKFKES